MAKDCGVAWVLGALMLMSNDDGRTSVTVMVGLLGSVYTATAQSRCSSSTGETSSRPRRDFVERRRVCS